MKNILVAFTGGTIGSAAMEGTINTSGDAPIKLLELFRQHYSNHQQIHFNTIRPLQILSENLAPPAWEILIEAIEAEHLGRYDGIIITHGTDTLAFTAAALSFYFHAANLPILLVSSNYPLGNPKANGLDNFICAVEFILQINQPGVFVPYRNQQQPMQLHKGPRLASSLQLSGDFFSVQGRGYMQFDKHRFTLLNAVSVQAAETGSVLAQDNDDRNGVATEKNTNANQTGKHQLKANFCKRILLIKPYPGLDYSHFDLTAVDAVLHDLYHSGTACSSMAWGSNLSLLTFIKNCREQGVKIYLAPAVKSGNAYESTRELLRAGAEMIWNMSLESAYVKLLLAYGNFDEEQQIIDFIDSDIAGEHVQVI